ncbi:transcriptional regulator [Nocardia farcinica]|uniref:toprim domain-containing protein n=1 Tax=Nocardia farcinica TaxID=37329 RepID=UPI000DFE786D|nr:toprim domain-containing protein [Nocardia farcinica]SUH41104.1 transcriptional regulator [Nocardia farcinica]
MSAPTRPRRPARAQGSWETITSALETAVGPGRPSGAWTKYCCPVHEGDGRGHKPSLGVKYDDAGQRTVVRCFAGCDNEQVLDVLGLRVRDMFDRRVEREGSGRGRRANRPRSRQLSRADRAIDAAGLPLTQPKKPDPGRQLSPWRTVATYPYLRADGTVAGEVVRREAQFEHTGRDKQFHQRRWNPENGRMEAGGFDPLPYQLPQLLAAIDEGRTVYIVEGEKDVAAAESAGLTATTNAGGALSWTGRHAEWLRGARTVVIVADRDPAGYRRAERVMATLSGLVERVRVVQAATGKDLHDHLQCGHEIADLEPIPYLDPFVSAPPPHSVSGRPHSAAGHEVSAASSPEGTPSMPDYMLAPSLDDRPADTTPDIDHASTQMVMFWRLLMQQMLVMAQAMVQQRVAAALDDARKASEERRADEARRAAEQAAVETRLRKLAERGLDNASRTEIAEAVRDAAAWAPDSVAASQALQQLAAHVRDRFEVHIDPHAYTATADIPTPEIADALRDAEAGRAAGERVRTAQEHMVRLVAAQDLDESVKAQLYAEIETWRANPTARQLDKLSKQLGEKGVPEQARIRLRFIAAYLGTPNQIVPDAELGAVRSVLATTELRKLDAPLVDPGEEAKPRVDRLLTSYQDLLRTGRDTASVRERLASEMAVLTPEEQEAVRARGNAIRANPGGTYAKLWPDHVDRDELATTVRMYATLAPQAEATAGKAADLDDATATQMRKAAAKHRSVIVKAIKAGKGLHDLERDQLKAVLRDVEAGVRLPSRAGLPDVPGAAVPEMLWADDRSAAAVDADRAAQVAHDTTRAHRRRLDELLASNQAPPGTARRARDVVTRVMSAQNDLAAGRSTLPDYERSGLDQELDAHLAAAGARDPLRHTVRAHLDLAASEAATVGKQASRISDRWGERRDAVVAARSTAKPPFDSPQRREQIARRMRAAGLSEDSIAQRLAAEAGQAHPVATALRALKDRGPRLTDPGAGIGQVIHPNPGKGRDTDRDLDF